MCDLEPCRLRPWHCINAPCAVVPVIPERKGCTHRMEYTVFVDRCHTTEKEEHIPPLPSGRHGGHPVWLRAHTLAAAAFGPQ